METKNIVYKHGHFYEKATSRRLELLPGGEFVIVALNKSFLEAKFAGQKKDVIFNQAEKKKEINAESDITFSQKIYNAGDYLYFYIDHKEGEQICRHEFSVKLLEDLYLYQKKNKDKKDARLFGCACVVEANISRTLEFFEEVHGTSLNEVYKNTFVHFWGNEGSPTSNAIDRFYEKPREYNANIDQLRRKDI